MIWTDAVQFALFLLGGVFALFFVSGLLPGGAGEVLREAAEGGKLHWLNARVGMASLWQEPINIWMGVIGGTFMVMSSHGAEQLIVQRVLACKSVADGRKALILSAAVIFPLFLIFLLVGAALWVYYQHFPQGPPDCGHSGRRDVLRQLGPHLACVGFDHGFCQKGSARQIGCVLSSVQQGFDGLLGGGSHSCGLPEPADGVRPGDLIYTAGIDQRRAAGGIDPGAVLETGQAAAGHSGHALLAGGHGLD